MFNQIFNNEDLVSWILVTTVLASGILILSLYLPQPLILMDKTKVYKQNIFCLKKCLKIYFFNPFMAEAVII